jgi:hypothetical protein
MTEAELEEKIIDELLYKGNKQVVDWITKLNPTEVYKLLSENLTYSTIREMLRLFDNDFTKKDDYY